MAISVAFAPTSMDFGGVIPGSSGPNIIPGTFPGAPLVSTNGAVIITVPDNTRVTAAIVGDTTRFKVRDIIVLGEGLEPIDPQPPGHPPLPLIKKKVREQVAQSDGISPLSVKSGQILYVRAEYQALHVEGTFTATLLIKGETWSPIAVPLSLFLANVITTVDTTHLDVVKGQQLIVPITVVSNAGPATNVFYQQSRGDPHTGLVIADTTVHVEAKQSVKANLTVTAQRDAAVGPKSLFVYQTAFNRTVGMILPVNVLDAPPPPPDPRVDHLDAVYVNGSTTRICQLTGGGDPEGKPHPNDTKRFALLGTDLGSSFDHVTSGEHRTYFFFGDTHTDEGAPDGDAIAFTTDDQAEPDGIHLQFIMGDRQWRRLVIPGISLENFEVPTGGFSHAGRIFVFATTGVLRKNGDKKFMENSVLASAADAHDNFDLAYFVSSRDDNVHTATTGGKFINVAPWKIRNDDWRGLPANAVPGGEGLIMAGTGRYRESAPYLAYAPLLPGNPPRKEHWRYLNGFFFWEPGFGPNGPPSWSEMESECIPLFDDKLGEISFCWNAGLRRWLLLYGGCAPGGCGIVLRSALCLGALGRKLRNFSSNPSGRRLKTNTCLSAAHMGRT
jgi:hypothetical protein